MVVLEAIVEHEGRAEGPANLDPPALREHTEERHDEQQERLEHDPGDEEHEAALEDAVDHVARVEDHERVVGPRPLQQERLPDVVHVDEKPAEPTG